MLSTTYSSSSCCCCFSSQPAPAVCYDAQMSPLTVIRLEAPRVLFLSHVQNRNQRVCGAATRRGCGPEQSREKVKERRRQRRLLLRSPHSSCCCCCCFCCWLLTCCCCSGGGGDCNFVAEGGASHASRCSCRAVSMATPQKEVQIVDESPTKCDYCCSCCCCCCFCCHCCYCSCR